MENSNYISTKLKEFFCDNNINGISLLMVKPTDGLEIRSFLMPCNKDKKNEF